MIVYKIENNKNGLFWNGSIWRPVLVSQGKEWKTLKTANRQLAQLISHMISDRNKYYNKETIINFKQNCKLEDLVVTKIEIKEHKLESHRNEELIFHAYMSLHLETIHNECSYFYKRMVELNVANNIEFIFILKPGRQYVSLDEIKAARAKLRLLKVKTRTYKEHRGMFGFYNRDQAMKARLALDVHQVLDLGAERKKIKETLFRKMNQ